MRRAIWIATLWLLVPIWSAYPQASAIGELKISEPSHVAAARQRMVSVISGGTSIIAPTMTLHDGYCCHADPVSYFGREPSFSTWMEWNWGFGGGTMGMAARTYLATFTGSSCLLIYHAGHLEGFFPQPGMPFTAEQFSPTPTRDFVRRAISEAGCDIVLASMPLEGENRTFPPNVGYTQTDGLPWHDYLGTKLEHAPPIGSPLRYFVEPVIGSLDHALSRRSYDKIIMVGLSGGGWTTTLVSAIDPRITHAYAIAGSVPFAARTVNEGDWEQFGGIQSLGVDYTDLYLMGTIDAAGQPTRRVGLFYNGADECCFKSSAVNGFAWWLKGFVAQAGFGSLRIFIDPNQTTHVIPQSHSDAIFSDLMINE